MIFSSPLSQKQPLATKLFSAAINSSKLARAYMLAGRALEDKWQLTYELAAYLNCEKIKSGQSNACLLDTDSNWCVNCRWIHDDKHPQAILKLSGSHTKSGKIAVEEARALVDETSKASPYFRVMVIDDASQEILHRPAANTLLKTIEEPRSNILLIFFAQVVNDVLPTILSRCQIINIASSNLRDSQMLSLSSPIENINAFLSDKLSDDESLKNTLFSLEKFTSTNSSISNALDLIEMINTLANETEDLDRALDFLIGKELIGRKNFSTSRETASYAKELFLLNQIAKEQSKHYVSQKALIETFVFAWHKLKQTGINPLKIRS